MKMNVKLCEWIQTALTILGVYFGVSVFLVFTFYFHNYHAGTWGLISAMFAGICLHLRLLRTNNRLSSYYSIGQLNALASFGFLTFGVSLGFTCWYIIYAAYHHIPMMPANSSYYLAGVWSAMSAKWSLVCFMLAYRYARFIRYSTPFLIIHESPDNSA